MGSNPFIINFFFRFLEPRKKQGKIAKIWYNRLSVEISYRSPPIADISTEISEILFLGRSTVTPRPSYSSGFILSLINSRIRYSFVWTFDGR